MQVWHFAKTEAPGPDAGTVRTEKETESGIEKRGVTGCGMNV